MFIMDVEGLVLLLLFEFAIRMISVETDVIILAADIELKEWSLVYSCSILEPDGYRYETVTGMTRSRTITPQLRQTLKSLMVGLGFHLEDQHSIRHTDCDWPDINRIEEEIKTD